ncbi:hypothetical protein K439DRAFT_1625171 [Ramaria rubella]|nr:hypothetical protein K439DRAFT_1625171 [Ramaria rubella]
MVLTSEKGPKRPILTYCQRKAAWEVASANRHAINADINKQEIQKIGCLVPASILSGWLCHLPETSSKQIDVFLDGHKGDLTEDEQACLTEIKLKIKQLDGVKNACKNPGLAGPKTYGGIEQAPVLSSRMQDTHWIASRLRHQLLALTARTDMETILFAVKGKAEHSMPGYISVSGKAEHYLIHRLKKYTSDTVKEFEKYVLTDVDAFIGLTLNHNGHLAEIKRKIRMEICQGLEHKSGYFSGDNK